MKPPGGAGLYRGVFWHMLNRMSDAARNIFGEGRRFTYADYKDWELDAGEIFRQIEKR
jgi:hypothetical protein